MSKREIMQNAQEETVAADAVATPAEEEVVRPYTLRRLKDGDLFPVLNIIATVFPKDLSEAFLQVASKERKLEEIGFSVITKLVIAILKNIPKVKEDLYGLLSDVSGIPVAEIEEMEFGTTPMMIWDIINAEKNAGFFKVVSKLL